METVLREESLLSRYLPLMLRIVINLVVAAIFIATIAKTLHDLPG